MIRIETPHQEVTRNIDPATAEDLLRRVPRACIAFASEGRPLAQPVILCWQDSKYVIGLPTTGSPMPVPDQEVVLLVDEGIYYFDLRAIYVRGMIQSVQHAVDTTHYWVELVPTKVIAWDYGTMHGVDNEHH